MWLLPILRSGLSPVVQRRGRRDRPRSALRRPVVLRLRPLEAWSSPAVFAAIVEHARSIGLHELIVAWSGFLQEAGADAQIDVFRTVSREFVPALA
jgi:hypothetical protein